MIRSSAKPVPKKLGTVQTIDMATGQVVAEKKNAFSLLGPPADKCQVCATDHVHELPHNQQSLYYQYRFHAEHGRWPTWTDAMAHCTDEIKQQWRLHLVALLRRKGMPVPDDLLDPKPAGR